MEDEKLIQHAFKAKENTYSPYSKFPVGAALLTENGKVYVGTNIENASYGATMCAERSAIFSAISQGEQKEKFSKIAIVSNMNSYTYPCFLCRQVMVEMFDENTEILMINKKGKYKKEKLKNLTPYSFSKEELHNV